MSLSKEKKKNRKKVAKCYKTLPNSRMLTVGHIVIFLFCFILLCYSSSLHLSIPTSLLLPNGVEIAILQLFVVDLNSFFKDLYSTLIEFVIIFLGFTRFLSGIALLYPDFLPSFSPIYLYISWTHMIYSPINGPSKYPGVRL